MENSSSDSIVPPSKPKTNDNVQSILRAFELLEHLANANTEVGITQLAENSGLPLPTIYRLIQTLVTGGYVKQGSSRRYGLGARLIRLGEKAGIALGSSIKPYLAKLAELTGETTNLALLDADEVVYVAQVPSKHSMRMFTEVGGRVHPHCTGVGKALLAQLPEHEVMSILSRTGMASHTPTTITNPEVLLKQLDQIRHQGYALDEGEQEIGVHCIAAPIPWNLAKAAISVSGPTSRISPETRNQIIPLLKATAQEISSSYKNS